VGQRLLEELLPSLGANHHHTCLRSDHGILLISAEIDADSLESALHLDPLVLAGPLFRVKSTFYIPEPLLPTPYLCSRLDPALKSQKVWVLKDVLCDHGAHVPALVVHFDRFLELAIWATTALYVPLEENICKS
jgi:hypothetical protein